jgi:chemosensory pili system protein ChpA (sensor histidine kinase/response regulator)
MDVVRTEVTAMGGRIETASTSGQGTAFRMLLPLTTAVTQVVLMQAGQQTVAVPSTLVETVRRVPAAELEQAYAQACCARRGGPALLLAGFLLQDALRARRKVAPCRWWWCEARTSAWPSTSARSWATRKWW